MERPGRPGKRVERPGKIEGSRPRIRREMSALEYAQVEHELPYEYTLQNEEGRTLHYLGVDHVFELDSDTARRIQATMTEYQPDMVLVEGMKDARQNHRFLEQLAQATREQTIEYVGEPGLAAKMALEMGAEWDSPEPNDADMYADLNRLGFEREAILLWRVLQQLPSYRETASARSFKEFANDHILAFEQATNWSDVSYVYEDILATAPSVIGREIDVEQEPNPEMLTDPTPWPELNDQQTVLNRIAEESSRLRDEAILRGIAQAMDRYERVLVVFGASHAVMQESALRSYFSPSPEDQTAQRS